MKMAISVLKTDLCIATIPRYSEQIGKWIEQSSVFFIRNINNSLPMNTAISVIMLTVAILTSALVIAVPNPQISAQQQQCISSQIPSTGGHKTASSSVTICGPAGSLSPNHGQAIKSDRSFVTEGKSSGSQTGFGASAPGQLKK